MRFRNDLVDGHTRISMNLLAVLSDLNVGLSLLTMSGPVSLLALFISRSFCGLIIWIASFLSKEILLLWCLPVDLHIFILKSNYYSYPFYPSLILLTWDFFAVIYFIENSIIISEFVQLIFYFLVGILILIFVGYDLKQMMIVIKRTYSY